MNEKVKETKVKALQVIQNFLDRGVNCADLKTLCECISIIGEDKDEYLKLLMQGATNGFGFNGKKTDDEPKQLN